MRNLIAITALAFTVGCETIDVVDEQAVALATCEVRLAHVIDQRDRARADHANVSDQLDTKRRYDSGWQRQHAVCDAQLKLAQERVTTEETHTRKVTTER